ncbi:MAG TPA: helix-turn-helix domain-containing protein [Caulobacteraceae bacterium]|jgi:transcriptional regulator with XRE-family HTH domain
MTDNGHTDRRGNHLRAWRELRGLTQAQLATIVGTEGSVISLLESGDRALSDKWLKRLAPALDTTPGLLLDYEPTDVDQAMLEVMASLPAAEARSLNSLVSLRAAKPDLTRARLHTRVDPYETHDPRVDPGYDIPEIWWKIPDEDKPAALAALKALIPRH